MRFIDASCRLGMPAAPGEGMPWKTEEILELMDRCHIEQAFAYHIVARDGEVEDGNGLLMEEIKKDSRLQPQWCAMPATFREFLHADALGDAMKKNGVKTLRIAPKGFAHSAMPYAMKELMDFAAQSRVPVFFDYGEAVGDALYDLCSAYPDVKFVVTNTAYALNRFLGPVLDACPNLYVGTGNYVPHQGLETFCRYYSADRLIFNTNLPFGSATAAVSLVCLANISKEEKEKIACGNMERLLSEVRL
ncbi:MAG: amidohydrolase family protein [Oscillospiraceae bacterium]|nr:amidohydrolase family protein [Oscillospiraceae bacterium]